MKTLGVMMVLLTTLYSYINNIYDYSIPKIEGGSQQLSEYQGKKILMITLPVQQNAESDTLLYCLDTLAAAHTSNLAVIATPSFEDGFTSAQREQLKQWYRSKLGNYIVISDGLYTRKASGSQQHQLFKWLTTDSLNEVFNYDVDGPGHKFFVSESGQLYGVLRPQTKISSATVYKTLIAQ